MSIDGVVHETGATATPAEVRVAVIGTGPRASRLADALATAVPGARPLPPSSDRPTRAVLDPERVDGVVAAAGTDLVLSCLRAGLPVLCDPPLASSPDAALAVLAAQADAGIDLVQIGFSRRHDPRFRELRQHVSDGVTGSVLLVHVVREVADPDDPAALAEELDTVAWLLGDAVESLEVSAVDGHRLCTVRTTGGVLVDLELRHHAGGARDVGAVRWEVVGTRGSAELAVSAAHRAEAERIMLTAWVRSVRSGVPVGARAADGYAALLAQHGAVAAD